MAAILIGSELAAGELAANFTGLRHGGDNLGRVYLVSLSLASLNSLAAFVAVVLDVHKSPSRNV